MKALDQNQSIESVDDTPRSRGDRRFVVLLIGAIAAATVAIDPLRETPFTDDWVYATMARTLLTTGHYQMHAWAVANPTLLIAWGALWAKLFGFSFTTLRLSALAVTFAGLAAFFSLCREHRLNARDAALLTLVLFGSPLIVRHAFSFMSDVPFVACTLLALVFYTRGLRMESLMLMAVGSLWATASILTRQFGAAFVPALLFVWSVGGARRRHLPLLAAGVVLPMVATAWQVQQGTQAAAWTAQLRAAEQLAFITSRTFALDLSWRLGTVPIYLALYAAPVALVGYVHRFRARSHDRSRVAAIGVEGVALLLCAVAVGFVAPFLGRPAVMPLLDWNFAPMSTWPWAARVAVTGVLALLGAWLCAIVVRRLRSIARSEQSPSELLLDVFTVILLLGQLVYVQFSDRYLIEFLPFVLIVMGRELFLTGDLKHWEIRLATGLTVAMLVISAAWERGTLARGEALWTASERVRTGGVSPETIHSDLWEWEYYNGSFDRWLRLQTNPEKADFNEYFDRFWPDEWRRARYIVTVRPPAATTADRRAIWSVEFRDGLLRRRFVDVVDQQPRQP